MNSERRQENKRWEFDRKINIPTIIALLLFTSSFFVAFWDFFQSERDIRKDVSELKEYHEKKVVPHISLTSLDNVRGIPKDEFKDLIDDLLYKMDMIVKMKEYNKKQMEKNRKEGIK